MRLDESTWTDAATLNTDLAILPVGATEQHGPHAPLSTDTLSATAIADAGASAYDGEVVVAPTVPYGISAEHRHFPGTLWLEPDTYRDVLRDVLASLAHHGWERIVVVNGHGGNADATREVAGEVSRDGEAFVAAFTWFDAVDEPDLGHAGPVETSLVLHHAPALVHEDRLETARDDSSEGWGEWVAGTNLAYDSGEFTENGVVGDPTGADAERGAALTAAAGEALADLLAAAADRPLDRPADG